VYSDGQQTAAWNDVYDASGNLGGDNHWVRCSDIHLGR
jgi:hypothetical protein